MRRKPLSLKPPPGSTRNGGVNDFERSAPLHLGAAFSSSRANKPKQKQG